MSTHSAPAGQLGTYVLLAEPREIPAHLRQRHEPRWWRTERGHELACEIGDMVDDLVQLACVALAALVVLGGLALTAAALWPHHPHLATAIVTAAIEVAGVWLWLDHRRHR